MMRNQSILRVRGEGATGGSADFISTSSPILLRLYTEMLVRMRIRSAPRREREQR